MNLIKGGVAAHTMEKVVDSIAKECDSCRRIQSGEDAGIIIPRARGSAAIRAGSRSARFGCVGWTARNSHRSSERWTRHHGPDGGGREIPRRREGPRRPREQDQHDSRSD